MWSLATLRTAADGDLHLSDLWAQHNEHRIPLLRLQFGLDYFVLDGTLTALLETIVVSCILLAVVMTWPFVSVWHDRTVTLGFLAFAITMTLTPAGWENLTWPFQVSFVQAYLFAVAAITLSVQRAAPLPESTPRLMRLLWLTAIIALGGAATYSLANGLMVWPIILAVLLLKRVEKPVIGIVSLAAALFIGSYLWQYEPVCPPRRHIRRASRIRSAWRDTSPRLGAPASAFGPTATQVLGIVGVALLAYLVAATVRVREREDHLPMLWGSAVSTFVFVSATQTALGRLDFGITQALSSRYSIAVAVFWARPCRLAWLPSLRDKRDRLLVRMLTETV